MTRVAVVGAASELVPTSDGRNDAELLAPVVERALRASGIAPSAIGVLGTASSEFLNGVVGGVMGAFDAIPGWPPAPIRIWRPTGRSPSTNAGYG